MGTRRSAEPWTAGASVFAGRRDPVWDLPAAEAGRLEALWHALEPLAGDPPNPPPLGYRGCFAIAPAGAARFDAYGGAVRRATGAGESEVVADPGRAFERFVLNSAPNEALRNQLLALAAMSG
jgi:hypothetical protein